MAHRSSGGINIKTQSKKAVVPPLRAWNRALCVAVTKQRRHRQKGLPPIIVLTPEERFTAGVREAELAAQRAAKAKEASRQAATELKAELERQQIAAAKHAADLAQARIDHAGAVDRLKAARASGRGKAEAEATWRAATAHLMELESGERPRWAPKPPADTSDPDGEDHTERDTDTEVDEAEPVSA